MSPAKTSRPLLSLTNQLRLAIKVSGRSHNQLAKECGISQPMLSRFMSGERDLQLSSASKVAERLGLSLSPNTVCFLEKAMETKTPSRNLLTRKQLREHLNESRDYCESLDTSDPSYDYHLGNFLHSHGDIVQDSLWEDLNPIFVTEARKTTFEVLAGNGITADDCGELAPDFSEYWYGRIIYGNNPEFPSFLDAEFREPTGEVDEAGEFISWDFDEQQYDEAISKTVEDFKNKLPRWRDVAKECGIDWGNETGQEIVKKHKHRNHR